MPRLSPLTDKILSYSEVPDFDFNEAVDWAVEMLLLDYDTPSLLVLAGLSKPVDLQEATNYLKAAVRELGLAFDTDGIGFMRYGCYLIKRIAQGQQVAQNLTLLYQLAHASYYEAPFAKFFLLYWAWDDFSFGEIWSSYWPDTTPQTIEQVVIIEAKQWLADVALSETSK